VEALTATLRAAAEKTGSKSLEAPEYAVAEEAKGKAAEAAGAAESEVRVAVG